MFLILLELIKNLNLKNPNKSPIKAKKCKKIFIRKSKNGKDIKKNYAPQIYEKLSRLQIVFFYQKYKIFEIIIFQIIFYINYSCNQRG